MSSQVDRTSADAHSIHVRIRRLVVDSSAAGDLTREQLAAQVHATLAQRLSDARTPSRTQDLARHVADAVAPVVNARVSKQTEIVAARRTIAGQAGGAGDVLSPKARRKR